MPEPTGAGEPCGAGIVLRYIEGCAAEEVWCQRIEGPCPYGPRKWLSSRCPTKSDGRYESTRQDDVCQADNQVDPRPGGLLRSEHDGI